MKKLVIVVSVAVAYAFLTVIVLAIALRPKPPSVTVTPTIGRPLVPRPAPQMTPLSARQAEDAERRATDARLAFHRPGSHRIVYEATAGAITLAEWCKKPLGTAPPARGTKVGLRFYETYDRGFSSPERARKDLEATIMWGSGAPLWRRQIGVLLALGLADNAAGTGPRYRW